MKNSLSPENLARVSLIIVCLLWTYPLFFASDPWIPLDYANFVIHETGHFVFAPFGRFIMMLGGTLMQLLVPLALIGYFVYKKAYFAAGFALFWLGNNFVNVGRYVYDARRLTLPIVGGEHDWNWILSHLDILKYEQQIGGGFYFVGRLFLVLGLLTMIGLAVKLMLLPTSHYKDLPSLR